MYNTLLTPPTRSTAKPQSKRIAVIDALRGFTLIGILMIHSYSYYFEATGIDNSGETLGFFDRLLAQLVSHFFDGTLYAIFSFLFGISFAIQLHNARAREKSFKSLFLWRLCILLVIGCLHRLLYPADILRLYAVLGTLLILCLYLNKKQILMASALLFLCSVVARLYYAELPEVIDPNQGSVADFKFLHIFGLYKIDFLIRSGRIFLIPSLFILGLYAGQIKFFNDNYSNRKLYLKLLFYATLILVSSIAAYLGAKRMGIALPSSIDEMVTIIEKTMLSFIIVTFMLLIYRVRFWGSVLNWLVPIGKMGLTIYISQSFFLLTFYKIDPNVLSKFGLTTITAITLFVVLLQRQFAQWWTSHHRYGPIEYVWRRLTYIRGTTLASSAKDRGSRKASLNLRPNSKCFNTETEREA